MQNTVGIQYLLESEVKMISKGIRGAITVEENSPEAIGAATIKLLTEW